MGFSSIIFNIISALLMVGLIFLAGWGVLIGFLLGIFIVMWLISTKNDHMIFILHLVTKDKEYVEGIFNETEKNKEENKKENKELKEE